MHHKFVVEGEKMVNEALLSNYTINQVITTENALKSYDNFSQVNNLIIAKENELKKISTLTTPNKVIAIVDIPINTPENINIENNLVLGYEDIRDPGNLGTIMRTADWFGINTIICSNDSVDVYNPKVVQATMGAIFRVKIVYVDLYKFVKDCKNKFPVYGTFIEGDNLYNSNLSLNGLILFGNESRGLSKKLEDLIDVKISIPGFHSLANKTESLNISISTAVICAEFRRKAHYSKQNER